MKLTITKGHGSPDVTIKLRASPTCEPNQLQKEGEELAAIFYRHLPDTALVAFTKWIKDRRERDKVRIQEASLGLQNIEERKAKQGAKEDNNF